MFTGQEPRQTTSNIGHLSKPSINAIVHGLNRHYYSIAISYRKNELEQKMLENVYKKQWHEGLLLEDFKNYDRETGEIMAQIKKLTKDYDMYIREKKDRNAVKNVGKLDAKRHLESNANTLMTKTIDQTLGSLIDAIVF